MSWRDMERNDLVSILAARDQCWAEVARQKEVISEILWSLENRTPLEAHHVQLLHRILIAVQDDIELEAYGWGPFGPTQE